jgi:hypothetical protein
MQHMTFFYHYSFILIPFLLLLVGIYYGLSFDMIIVANLR